MKPYSEQEGLIEKKGRRQHLKEYAKLLRLYALPVIAVIPILGLLSVKGIAAVKIDHILVLLVTGAFTHVFGHVFNEYMDVDVDALSLELRDKPLVSGAIPRGHALAITIAALIGAVALPWLYFSDVIVLVMLMSALAFAGLYNLLHKKIAGTDVFIAGAVFFSFLFGATSASRSLTPLTYIVGVLLFLRELCANSIESALKDVEHESAMGIKTVPIMLGVRVKGRKMIVPRRFIAYVYCIEACFMVAFFYALYMFGFSNLMVLGPIVILAFAVLYAKRGYLHMEPYEREELKRRIGVSGAVTFVFFFAVLFTLMGLVAASILAVSFLCSVASIAVVYGKSPMI
ncbi:MAG: UbiA family prenyltransferase [Thermoplasmata archaeon]|nr:MAG: UbiA family prenyltransferase [Thermoplasmata archaeon]